MVELDPGATWINVHAALKPYHISTAGGQLAELGLVALPFASAEKGFGANNVVNYEIVLSNGTIVNANEAENEDLSWMKLPSTNYGIVTRFDMRTYPSSAIWGAVNVCPFAPTLASEPFAQSEKWGHDDTNKDNMVLVAMMRSKGMSAALAVQVNEVEIAQDPLTSTIQHFQKSFINAAKESPIFNALGEGKDDLVNIHIRMEWANPDDDAALEEAAYELGTLAETEARKRGILYYFIYLNYADGNQPVYERSHMIKQEYLTGFGGVAINYQ
ncbi:hypothetical protein V8C34DRAFT_319041 [Trichoderma compactum]